MKRKIRYRPKKILEYHRLNYRMSQRAHQGMSFFLDGKEFEYLNGDGGFDWEVYTGRGYDDIEQKNFFKIGSRNIFLYSENENYGYKIFSFCCGQHARKVIYCLRRGNRGWESFLRKEVLSLEIVRSLHKVHNVLYKKNVGPKSFGVVEFTDEITKQKFFGLKIEKIKGEAAIPTENEIKEICEALSNAGYSGDYAKSQYGDEKRKVGGYVDKRGIWRDGTIPANFCLCEKRNSTVLLDIEYQHLCVPRLGYKRYKNPR